MVVCSSLISYNAVVDDDVDNQNDDDYGDLGDLRTKKSLLVATDRDWYCFFKTGVTSS